MKGEVGLKAISLKAGTASKVINNELGTPIQGATVNQIANSIRDDLEANALYLNKDSYSTLFVSCDLVGLLPEFISSARKAMSQATGLKERDIKRRSPAKYTGIFGLADGYNGYCPTMSGIIGGGYSGEPIWWTRLSPEGGYLIVDAISELLRSLWKD